MNEIINKPVELTPIEREFDALLQKSAFYLQSYRPIEAQNVLNEALRLVEGNEVNWQLKFAAYRNLGDSYVQTGNIDEGIKFFIKSYEVNQDGNVKAAAANMIATYSLMKGDNVQAKFYADKAKETTEVPELLSRSYQIYGAIALAEGNHQIALEKMNKAAELAETAHCLTDLAMIIMDMSTVFQSMGMMETALSEVCRAERYVKESHNLDLYFRCAVRRAKILIKMGKDEEAKALIIALDEQKC
jgi:tetratricopeptide (TPR) repeat protein